MFQQLLSKRGLWEEVAADRSLLPAAAEETLRMYGLVHGNVRTTTREVEVAGVTLPKGSAVMVHMDSADRDDSTFKDPDRFDLHRSKAELGNHLAFGKGTHFCIGAPFARPMARIALDTMLDRIPDLELAEPDADLEIYPSIFVGGLTRLDVVWDAGGGRTTSPTPRR
jgi:cytochrome P450